MIIKSSIKPNNSGESFHASIYNTIAYNIIKTRNCSSPNLVCLAYF